MAALTDAQLTVLATVIEDNTTENSNTATLVGELFNDLVDSKVNIDNTVRWVKISVSSAEILALSTVPKTLIAAPGAGKFINVLSAAFRLNFVSIAYATNTTLRLEIGSFNPIVATNTIIASATTDFIVASPTQTLEVSGSPDWVNTLLRAKILTGNPTAGDSTLDIYISYNVVTL